MKINMKNLFSFGGTERMRIDRAGNMGIGRGEFKLNQRRNTGLEQVPTETLRTLWLAKYDGRAAPMKQVYAESAEDFADVAQELFDRKQVRYEEVNIADETEIKRYFVLEREDGNH